MNKSFISNVVCLLLWATRLLFANANGLPEAEVKKLLRDRIETQKRATGIVVGIVDATGPKVFSYGKLDDGDSPEVDGDTLFEIGSVSKVFTGLLLELMIERGDMKLDDPISKFLPKSVKTPTTGGKEITLRNLVTHTAALPRFPSNLALRPGGDPFADYTVEKFYAFLSNYTPPYEIGTTFAYSNVGFNLLAHLMSLQAGTSYEALLVSQISEPLRMHSTRITLSPELQARLATGHVRSGAPSHNFNAPLFVGAGGIVSSANDMLKFIAANLGLTKGSLAASMQKTHEVQFEGGGHRVGLAWFYRTNIGSEILAHGGLRHGYRSLVALDTKKRRGVVVLANSTSPIHDIGWRLLGVKGGNRLLMDETSK